jgi:hypothetical protein
VIDIGRPSRLALLLLALGHASSVRAAEPSAGGADAASLLPAQVQQLSAEVQQLRREVTALRAGRPVGDGDGPRFTVRLTGFVQADAVLYRQDSEDQLDESTGEPLNQTRFLIRRARLRAEAQYLYFGGAVEFDGNTVQGPLARILGAEVSAQWPAAGAPQPYVKATLGLFKIPFGYEVPQSDTQRLFLERSNIIRALFPGEFDLGIRVHGGWRFLRYVAAAMNGEPAGERAFAARDPNQSKDFLGRLGIDVTIRRGLRLAAGASGLYGTGFHPGTPTTKDVLTWRDDNQDGQVQPSELQVLLGSAATPSQNFNRGALGIDAQIAWEVPVLGELQIYGEFVMAYNLDRGLVPADPVASGRDLRETGWYLGFTQQVGPYVALGLRYDHYEPDADASQQLGATLVPVDSAFSTLAAVLAVQYGGMARLSLEYDNNRNGLGLAAGGTPITLGRDALTVRGQVVF